MVCSTLLIALLAQVDLPETRALEDEANRKIDAASVPNQPAAPADRSALPVGTTARIHLDSTIAGAKLIELPSGRTVCEQPCSVSVRTSDLLEYRLSVPGAMDSKEFSLHDAPSDAVVHWRPAKAGLRALGLGVAAVGALAYGAGLAIAFFALYVAVGNSFNGFGSRASLEWAWSALPLGLGGFAVLAVGMTVVFRFGVERL